MNRIEACFAALAEKGEAAFIPYIVCGDPDLATSKMIVLELEKAGADIVEFGVPFSDPVADGVANQEGALRALKGGVNLQKVIDLVRDVRADSGIPILLFTYYNPVYVYGTEAFAAACAEAGADGVLCVDLPPEEADDYIETLHSRGLCAVFLITPTTNPERMKIVAKKSSGFVYYVSRTGVTGERDSLEADVPGMVRAIKEASQLPVAVGFGISKPEHARAVAAWGGGVVVGSAIVRTIGELGATSETPAKVAEFVRPLIEAAKSARRGAPA